MLLLSATLHSKDLHALRHETFKISIIFLSSFCERFSFSKTKKVVGWLVGWSVGFVVCLKSFCYFRLMFQLQTLIDWQLDGSVVGSLIFCSSRDTKQRYTWLEQRFCFVRFFNVFNSIFHFRL